MTTNTKAITECTSCCWIIYCKYLFPKSQTFVPVLLKMLWLNIEKSRFRGRLVERNLGRVREDRKCLQFFSRDSSHDDRKRRRLLYGSARWKLRRKTRIDESESAFFTTVNKVWSMIPLHSLQLKTKVWQSPKTRFNTTIIPTVHRKDRPTRGSTSNRLRSTASIPRRMNSILRCCRC